MQAADRVVLPWVGAFADGMAGLRSRNLVEPIQEYIANNQPFLGICLGMQLLMTESTEFGLHPGLGVVEGRVVAISQAPGHKVPQIGWNRIFPPPGRTWTESILDTTEEGAMVYFVHSFTAVPAHEEARLADASYGGQRVSAAIRRGSAVGCQFHPEKSSDTGLKILRRFLDT
jgi:imidazole glycerol-phosphate synthase subunit HisH